MTETPNPPKTLADILASDELLELLMAGGWTLEEVKAHPCTAVSALRRCMGAS